MRNDERRRAGEPLPFNGDGFGRTGIVTAIRQSRRRLRPALPSPQNGTPPRGERLRLVSGEGRTVLCRHPPALITFS